MKKVCLVKSTNSALEKFETKYGVSLITGDVVSFEVPLTMEPMSSKIKFSKETGEGFIVKPDSIEYGSFIVEGDDENTVTVEGFRIHTENSVHTFREL